LKFIKEIMKQTLILVVILLATFSMVNAIPHQLNKRATTFTACPTGSTYPLTVTLQPDPPVAGQECLFNIGGTFPIDTGSQLVVQPLDSAGNTVDQPITTDICTIAGFTCSTPTDATDATDTTPFSIIQSIPVPADAIAPYSLIVTIIGADGSILACSLGTIAG
jgi:hypothetical protein